MKTLHTRAFPILKSFAIVLLLTTSAHSQGLEMQLREILVPQLGEFTTQHTGEVDSFDISPDGKTLAVEFGTREKDGTFGVWVAVWDVDSGHLVAVQQVEWNYPTYNFQTDNKFLKAWNGLPLPGYKHDLRFSPNGNKLIVLTGPHLVVLSFPELKSLYSFADPEDPHSEHERMMLTDFAVSAQGNRLALLRQYTRVIMYESGHFDPRSFELTIADLSDGKVLARWSKPGHDESVALSPDGTQVALTVNPVATGIAAIPTGQNDVFILKAESGELVRAFNTGYAAGDAQFLRNGDKLVTIPADQEGQPEFYPRNTVRVWNLATGQIEQELRYPKYGVRSSSHVAISANGEWLAVANPWHNPSDIQRDRDVVRGWVRLLVWNLPSAQLTYESGDLQSAYQLQPAAPQGVSGSEVVVRESASGSRLAVGGQLISVYSIDKEQREIAEHVPAN
jgi:WD40 repeat protein